MQCYVGLWGIKSKVLLNLPPDIRHPEELSLLRKPRDPKKKKKKLEEAEEEDQELEGPLLTPGSGGFIATKSNKNIGLWMPWAKDGLMQTEACALSFSNCWALSFFLNFIVNGNRLVSVM